MRRVARHKLSLGLVLAFCILIVQGCGAKNDEAVSVEEFYSGSTVTIIVGFSAGGGNDGAARLLSRHLGRHIPGNPRVVVQNIPGGGSFVAANYVYNAAPKDGTVIGLLVDTAPIAPLLQFDGAHYDPRNVNWIGALADRGAWVVAVRSDAPAKTFEEAREKEVVLGTAGPNGAPAMSALLLNELTGTKFKIIYGYPGAAETLLAMERGEVQGRAATGWHILKKDHPEWIAEGFVRPLVQLSLESQPGLEGVPLAIDYVQDETERQIMELALGGADLSRVFSVAPGTPESRVAALRTAFLQTTSDPAFIADAEKTLSQPLTVSGHEKVEAFIDWAYALPEDVRARAARYVGSD